MFGSLSLKNWSCLPGPACPALPARPWMRGPACRALRARRQLAGRQASPASAATGLSKNSSPPREGRKTAPLWARSGSPAPPGPSLSLEGTGGARKASLPPGYLSLLPPGARAPLALCETLADLGHEPQISRHRINR